MRAEAESYNAMDIDTDFYDEPYDNPSFYDDRDDDLPREYYVRRDRTIGIVLKLRRIFRGDYGPYDLRQKCWAAKLLDDARALRLQPYSDCYDEMDRLRRIFERENRKLLTVMNPDKECSCDICAAFFVRWPKRLNRNEEQWERRRINVTRDDGTRKRWDEAERAEYRHDRSKRFC
jgi:hypothetical protein